MKKKFLVLLFFFVFMGILVAQNTHSLQFFQEQPPATTFLGEYGPPQFSPHELGISYFRPVGNVYDSLSEIAIEFAQPMIAVGKISEVEAKDLKITISPPLAGDFRWKGTSTIVFNPRERLKSCTRYRVTIPSGISSVGGKKLPKDVSFEFQTFPPTIASISPYNGRPHITPEQTIQIYFSHLISTQDVSQFVGVFSAPCSHPEQIQAVPISISSREENTKVIQLKSIQPLAKDSLFWIKVRHGWKTVDGNVPSNYNYSSEFRTYSPLSYFNLRCTYPDRSSAVPDSTVYLIFNNPIDYNTFKKYISINPAPESFEHSYIDGNSIALRSYLFQLGKHHTITVSPDLTDIFGQKLGRSIEEKIYMFDYDPSLSISPSSGRVLSHSPRGIQIQTLNVPKVHLSIYRANAKRIFSPAVDIRSQSYYGEEYFYRDLYLSDPKSLKKITLEPKSVLNTNCNELFSLDKVLQGKPGILYVVASTDQLRFHYDSRRNLSVAYQYIISDIGTTVRYGAENILVFVSSMKTGKPIANASLVIRNHAGKIAWKGTTDKNGLALAPGKRNLDQIGVYPTLFVVKDDDINYLVLQGGNRDGWINGYTYNNLPSYQPFLAYLYTERGVYQPGDSVELSGILRKEDPISVQLVGAAKETVHVRARDARGKEIFNDNATISDFDTFSIRIPIPKDGPVGTYYVDISVDGKGSASTSFNVQEYRTNEFEVSISPDQPYFIEGKPVSFTIAGKYLFGASMANAEVKWRLQILSHEPTKPSMAGYEIGGVPLSWSAQGYGENTAKMDKDGLLKITLYPHNLGNIPRQKYLPRHKRIVEEDYDEESPEPVLPEQPEELPSEPIKEQKKEKMPANPSGIYFNGVSGVYQIVAEVIGANRQAITSSGSFAIHPDQTYMGIRLEQTVLEQGDQLPVSVVALDPQGNLLSGIPITIKATHIFKELHKDGYWVDQSKPFATQELVSSTKPVSCSIRLSDGGAYQISAETVLPNGKRPIASSQAYAVGTSPALASQFQQLEIQSDKKEYSPGETAKLLIRSPYLNANGVLCFERNDLISHIPMSNVGPACLVKFKVEENMVPNVVAYLFLVRGAQEAGKLGVPEFRSARCEIKVSSISKRLTVQIESDSKFYAPEESVQVDIAVKNYKGESVPSHIAVMVVDEGVLSLTGFTTPDPLLAFIRPRASWMATQEHSQENIWLIDILKQPMPDEDKKYQPKPMSAPMANKMQLGREKIRDRKGKISKESEGMKSEVMAEEEQDMSMSKEDAASPVLSDDSISQRMENIQIRKVFATTTYFNPGITTDKKGKAKFSFKLPQNLTSFRIMAVAVDKKDLFGSSQSKITVRKPLTLKVSLPRFAHVGDRFKAGVVVTNLTGKTGQIVCSVKVNNAIEVIGDLIQKKRIADGESAEIAYNLKAMRAEDATFTFAAFVDKYQDGVIETIPIKVPASTEVFATYNVVREEAKEEAILPPGDVYPKIGGLDITFSSTAMTNLQDGIAYLLTYPYGCIEQTSSTLFPLIGLHDLIREFKIAGLDDEEIRNRIQAGVKRIASMQREEGGFSYWPGGNSINPWATAYALFVLLQVREADHPVPAEVIEKAVQYLSLYTEQNSIDMYEICTQTMALVALSMGKKPNTRAMQRLYEKNQDLPIFAKAFLAYAYTFEPALQMDRARMLLQQIINQAVEDADAVYFKENEQSYFSYLMHTSTRTDAIVLWLMSKVNPDHALMPKIVRGIMKARIKGKWSNTQENAWALLSLSKYLQTVEKSVPKFHAILRLDKDELVRQPFIGRSTSSFMKQIGIDDLVQITRGRQTPLTIEKNGEGVLYYRLGITYAPAQIDIPALERGFSVQRSYEVLKGEQIKDEEVLKYKIGTYVKVRITLTLSQRKFFVALDDALPAGFEPVIASFATSAQFYARGSYSFNHTEQRKDRALAFADKLEPGTYYYEHIIRATTPGTFLLPPSKAEEMYHPEIFGRSPSQVVIITE